MEFAIVVEESPVTVAVAPPDHAPLGEVGDLGPQAMRPLVVSKIDFSTISLFPLCRARDNYLA